MYQVQSPMDLFYLSWSSYSQKNLQDFRPGAFDPKVEKQNSCLGFLPSKLILKKSILYSYPMYTCAISLAPILVINILSIEIKKLLWQGGKAQGKKYNLVKWDSVMEERHNGGLGIRDL